MSEVGDFEQLRSRVWVWCPTRQRAVEIPGTGEGGRRGGGEGLSEKVVVTVKDSEAPCLPLMDAKSASY